MLLPTRRDRDRSDRRARGRPQHRDNAGVLGVGPYCGFGDAGADGARLAVPVADLIAGSDR